MRRVHPEMRRAAANRLRVQQAFEESLRNCVVAVVEEPARKVRRMDGGLEMSHPGQMVATHPVLGAKGPRKNNFLESAAVSQ